MNHTIPYTTISNTNDCVYFVNRYSSHCTSWTTRFDHKMLRLCVEFFSCCSWMCVFFFISLLRINNAEWRKKMVQFYYCNYVRAVWFHGIRIIFMCTRVRLCVCGFVVGKTYAGATVKGTENCRTWCANGYSLDLVNSKSMFIWLRIKKRNAIPLAQRLILRTGLSCLAQLFVCGVCRIHSKKAKKNVRARDTQRHWDNDKHNHAHTMAFG